MLRTRFCGAGFAVFALLLVGFAPTGRATTATAPARASAPKQLISVRDSPGYVPLHDADSLAEKIGRRTNAPLVSMPFTGGKKGLDEVAIAVLGALHAGSADSLMKLSVSENEFRYILWPEFPQSRPATGIVWSEAWVVLYGRLNGGSVASARDFSGHVYQFIKLERTAKTVEYKNFRLHNGITMVAKDDEGAIRRFTFIRSIAERKGRFKIYTMKD